MCSEEIFTPCERSFLQGGCEFSFTHKIKYDEPDQDWNARGKMSQYKHNVPQGWRTVVVHRERSPLFFSHPVAAAVSTFDNDAE